MRTRLNTKLVADAVQYLLPLQFGVGVKRGAEGIVHSLRSFLKENVDSDKAVLKTDFKNAFNLVDRKCLLDVMAEKFPEAFPFVFQAYGTPSFLSFGCNTILSQRGVQQGDPLGPLLFSLIIHPFISSLTTKFNAWYLDDGTLAGFPFSIADDLKIIKNKCEDIGLELNFSKWEFFPVVLKKTPPLLMKKFLRSTLLSKFFLSTTYPCLVPLYIVT